MAQQTYISCIKINGVPILPPMITEDIRKEIKYYKHLAIKVEEKLKILQYAKSRDKRKLVENETKIQENTMSELYINSSDTDNSFNSDNENVTPNTNSNTISASETPIKIEHGFMANENLNNPHVHKQNDNLELVEQKIYSDESSEEDFTKKHSFNLETTILSTDLIEDHIGITESKIKEKMSHNWKPEVPRTLDIIPITVDDSNIDQKDFSMTTESNNVQETPKLVRQGSYILDTPSPMLLAHMQTELNNTNDLPNTDYIPTLGRNVVRRKEWNITQAKSEWRNEIKNGEFIITDTQQTLKNSKCRRNSLSNKSNYNLYKNDCEQVMLEPDTRINQTTRSVDCIQMMLAKENIYKLPNTKINNSRKKYSISSDDKENHSPQKWKENKNISMLNMTNKLGGSLGDLNDVETQMHRINDESQLHRICGCNESFEEENANNDEINESIEKYNSANMSGKLLTVLKEIEEVHKRQMSELVIRQQQEQSSLQKEFERQQLLLLTEIKKSFPEISSLIDDKHLSSCSIDQSVSTNNTISKHTAVDITQQNKNIETLFVSQKDNISLSNNHMPTPVCPVNYSKNDLNGSEQQPSKCYEFIQLLQNDDYEASISKYNCTSIKNKELQEHTNTSSLCEHKSNVRSESKKSMISRQLFPLDCKTVHVPIIDSSMYADKHILAASIINAYARGYLVRRLMKTERVITLKNTYKEALHCMLKLHVDAPLNLPELHFLRRLQLQCDAASMNIVELFAQSPAHKMQIIAHDREIKRCRTERPTSARSYSFATQRTLARKKLKQMGDYQSPIITHSHSSRTRCQTWTSEISQHLISPNTHQTIKRSTSAGTVRKPWR
ncbi:hypothetical protein KPH14_004867 [Odynerus spinipes]|uniref:Uncharacterized protein n=1 Tax=Odynerus spinipes TaxID=1348599 RepID=A0AAD9RMQ3_9HYME|nr:hypothetical protein KPH14_004867 [Odynerus spinipes]